MPPPAVSVVLLPVHIATDAGVMVGVGSGLMVTLRVAAAVQPDALVTVTV